MESAMGGAGNAMESTVGSSSPSSSFFGSILPSCTCVATSDFDVTSDRTEATSLDLASEAMAEVALAKKSAAAQTLRRAATAETARSTDVEDEEDEDDELLAIAQEHSCDGTVAEEGCDEDLKDGDTHRHARWAAPAPGIDLTGSWRLLVTDEFKKEYEVYLSKLGFNRIVRSIALQIIGRTTEETLQSDCGRSLTVVGRNPRGTWERTLVSSGFPDFPTYSPDASLSADGVDWRHHRVAVKTADGEDVLAEAWWERQGTAHRSWLRGGSKYGGGDFESIRYLEKDGSVLVCESIFHPRDATREKAIVHWRFLRDTP